MKILIIGNITIDHSYEIDHLPRPGETILAMSQMTDIGGKGLNQAIVAKRAGASIIFRSKIGNESDNSLIYKRLGLEGIDPADLLVGDGETDDSLIFLSKMGENCIVSTKTMAQSIEIEDVNGYIDKLMPNDILLMQGNLTRKTTEYCIKAGHSLGVKVVVNPAPIEFEYNDLYSYIDFMIVNEVESQILTGETNPQIATKFFLQKNVKNVLVTIGEKGALLVTNKTGLVHIPAMKVRAVDTTGAGDVFVGTFCAGLATGLSHEMACAWAVNAASLSVTRRGTFSSFPNQLELNQLINKVKNNNERT